MKIENFKSTKSLYGVSPKFFENMTYFQAVKEKIKLAQKRIDEINKQLNYRLPEDEYKNLNRQLVECKKAKEFNERLLEEYKREKERK